MMISRMVKQNICQRYWMVSWQCSWVLAIEIQLNSFLKSATVRRTHSAAK